MLNPSAKHAAAIQSRPTTQTSRWKLPALCLCMLLPTLGTSMANVALPTLARTFDASFQSVQWIVIAYLLATTALTVGMGRLGDTIGQRRLLLIGIVVFTLGSALCGTANNLPWLISARVAQGLGAAILMTMPMALASGMLTGTGTGNIMGLLGTMSALGTALGPTIGGALLAGFGWRAIFVVSLPMGGMALFLAHRNLPPEQTQPEPEPPPFDVGGTCWLAVTITAYSLALSLGHRGFGLINVIMLWAAAMSLGAFLFTQSRKASPLIQRVMFAATNLRVALILSLLVSTVIMTTLTIGPFYLSRSLGLGALPAGIVMSVGPLITALAGVPAGRMADRCGAQQTTIAGLTAMLGGCLLLALLPETFGVLGYVLSLTVLTSGYAMFQTANNTEVMSNVPSNQRGIMSGMLNASRNLGLITGASGMGTVFAWSLGTDDVHSATPEAVALSLRVTFGVGCLVLLAATGLAVRNRIVQSLNSRAQPDQSATGLFAGPILSNRPSQTRDVVQNSLAGQRDSALLWQLKPQSRQRSP